MKAATEAIVTPGYRVAFGMSVKDPTFNNDGGTIHLQLNEFKKRGLDFDSYFGGEWVSGTLNLSISPQKVRIIRPEYFFQGVRWTDKFDQPGQPPYVENVFLDKAGITFKGATYPAMIYMPDPSTKPGHFQPPTMIEVIAAKIPNIAYGDKVTLHYSPEAFDVALESV